MPSSYAGQLNEIVELIQLTAPRSLLDIGIGFGKYGFLAREYLELPAGRLQKSDWQVRIDGIEAFPQYITPAHKYVYDQLYIGNAQDILGTLERRYDLILMVDVLEHFDRESGLAVLRQCEKRGRNIIVAVPRKVKAQGEVFGNAFETHKHPWSHRDFREFKNQFLAQTSKSNILYMGEDCKKVGRAVRARKRREAVSGALDWLRLRDAFRRLLRK